MEKVDLKPLVSVIVPVYNVEAYLERCVKSILKQKYQNIEILLINDGSSDQSGVICDILKSKNNCIKVFHQANGGMSVARNTGLLHAKGEYISFVDSDDWIEKEMIHDMVHFALQNNLKLVECGIVKSLEKNKKRHQDSSAPIIETNEEAMFRLLTNNNFSVWRRIYHKDIIKGRKFIPNKINEDVFFTIDSINSVKRQGFIPTELYIYNTENVSITRSPYSLQKLNAKDALYHIVEHTKNYSAQIRMMANQYLLRGLINHYNPLFTHAKLDQDYRYRKIIKKEILAQLEYMNQLEFATELNSFENLLLKLPIRIYGIPIKLNRLRINLQHKVLKFIHV